jgi:hypothetical protein
VPIPTLSSYKLTSTFHTSLSIAPDAQSILYPNTCSLVAMDRVDSFLNDPEQPRYPGFSPPLQAAPSSRLPRGYQRPIPTATPASPTFSNTSTASTSRDSGTYTISRSSTATSDTSFSSVPPWHGGPPSLNHQIMTTLHNYGYDLPCEFTFLGCNVRFHPEHFEAWFQHSLSHFAHNGPPPYAICVFCDDEREGCFQSRNDRDLNYWRSRMIHIKGHYQGSDHDLRPDHFVIDYMWTKGLISEEDYYSTMKYTERPQVDGLVTPGFEVPEKRIKREMSLREPHDLEKEKRQIKKEHKKGTSRRYRTSDRGDIEH